jgi:hypothetical protein
MSLKYMGVAGYCKHGEYADKPCDKCEVERLRARVAELEAINQRRFISTMSFGEIQGDGTVKAVEYRHECTLCGATSAELELIEHETDCPLRAAGGDDARHS